MSGLLSILFSVGVGMGIFYNPPQPPVATPHVIAPAPGIGVPLNTYQLKLITDVDWIPAPPLPTLNVKRTWQTTDALGLVMPENTYQVAQIGLWWTIPPPLPTLDVKLTPPSVDLPPFYRNAQVNPIAVAWIPLPPLPTLAVKLTPPTGVDQPPLRSADGARLSLLAWADVWIAQTARPSSAWNVPPLVSQVPYTAYPFGIRAAWEPVWLAPPAPVTIAPLTLVYGAQPAPQAPLSLTTLTQMVAQWTQTWPAQSASPSAAWNVPPLLVSVPYTALPRLIWAAWEPVFIAPPPPVMVAPLTLTYGSQPPLVAPLALASLVTITSAWAEPVLTPRSLPSAAWIVTVVPPTSTGPKLILVDGRLAIRLDRMNYKLLD